MPQLTAWFEADPARFEWELQQLESRGWAFEIDEAEQEQGNLLLRGVVPCSYGDRRLTVAFPYTYPEHRVEVFDETGDGVLPLHQEPYLGRLCLLENTSAAWTPNDSAAVMVERAIELFEAAPKGETALEELGVGAPEPRSTYYPYLTESSALVPEGLLSEGDGGWFHFQLEGRGPHRGLIARVDAPESGTTAEASEALRKLYRGEVIRGAWIRSEAPPPWIQEAGELERWAHEHVRAFPEWLRRESHWTRIGNEYFRVFAIVYQDDGPEGEHDQWLTCIAKGKRGKGGATAVEGAGLLRPFIYSQPDQERRISSLVGMKNKRVAVIGLGTVGAPVALELARTSLLEHLFLVDHDYYAVWNLVRHPLPIHELGRAKAEAIARQISFVAPEVSTEAIKVKIGDATPGRTGAEQDLLTKLESCDLIIDATADGGTSRYLNRLSLQLGTPLLVASVTEGAWGGEVVRCIPGKSGCYECYLWGLREGSVPKPSQDLEASAVYTRGCGFPTFQGAGFDAVALATDVVRVAAAIFSDEKMRGPEDAILIRHNRATTRADFPRYELARLEIHPRCSWHGSE